MLLVCAAVRCEKPASVGDGQAHVVVDQPAGGVVGIVSRFDWSPPMCYLITKIYIYEVDRITWHNTRAGGDIQAINHV